MVLEQILKGADDFEKTPPLQPYDLDDRFRRLLVFPRDFENALEKAEQIVGGSRAGKEHVQQAILMLGYESLEEILLKIDRAKEVYQLSSDFKAEEIQWVVDHARSRDELNAVLGLQKNDFSIKERIINLSIKAVQFLQANFLPVEILKICGFGFIAEKIFRAIDSGKLTGENVVAFRTLFNSEEQAVLLDRFPEILVKLNLEGRYQQVIPETRAQLIDDYNSAKFILASRGEKIAYDQIGPINLAVLFSLSEDERMALLKNPFIDIWMNRFTEDTLRILETLKKYAKDDYLYFLQNCNDSSLFLVDSREFESGLAVVEKIFKGVFPWKRMYPEIMDKMNFRSSGISYFSSSALMAVAEKYGEDVARGLFLSGVDIFSQSENEGAPLVSRMVRIEEIVGIDNFKELLHHDEFVNLIHSIARYDEDQQIRFGRSLYEQMVRAKQQYGEERFLQLCKNFGGLYFIRFSDVLVTTLSQDTLDLIFAAKRGAYPFFDIGFYLMQGKGGYETLRAFAALPIERQRLLVSEFAAGELMSQTIFAKWIENKTDRLVRVLFKSGFGTILHFGYGLVQRILSRIDLLIGIFSEDGVIELFQKRIVIKIIYESSEETVAKWSELLALPEEDRKYFLKNGLALEVLKNPSKAKLLKDDLGARLSVFFDCDPQIANQIDGLVGRLNQLGERGLNVDLVIRKMVKRITDPRVSDTDKIWYLFTRVFGEEWILKGSDPQLTNLTFRERFSRMRRRLEDIVTLNEDPNLIREADKRNREYAKDYVQSSVVKQPLLIHGKKDFYPQDLHLGYTAAEFLGMFQYKWEEKTANALNFMILEPGQELIDAYFSQKDPIVVNFGASRENALGVTHVFLPSDVEAAHGSCASKLYGGQHHGEQHMLILCGVPSTTELCALVSLKDKNHFNRVKRYYAKKPFYVPLIDVNSGVLVFTAEEYEAMRRQLIADGAVVDLKANTSVDAFVTKVLEYYSERDRAHGIKHIENTLQHVVAVCSELYEQSQDWFVSNGISYMEFVNLVKVAVVAHDIARDTKEDWEHAIAGAQIIADILDYGLSRRYLQLIQTAIKQHNLPKEERWGDDPITQALYDIDKADTSFERGADSKYVEMILPTVQSNYTRNILTELIDGKKV